MTSEISFETDYKWKIGTKAECYQIFCLSSVFAEEIKIKFYQILSNIFLDNLLVLKYIIKQLLNKDN